VCVDAVCTHTHTHTLISSTSCIHTYRERERERERERAHTCVPYTCSHMHKCVRDTSHSTQRVSQYFVHLRHVCVRMLNTHAFRRACICTWIHACICACIHVCMHPCVRTDPHCTVSGNHCLLTCDKGSKTLTLQDTSTNGTWVQDEHVRKCSKELQGGEKVQIVKGDKVRLLLMMLLTRCAHSSSFSKI